MSVNGAASPVDVVVVGTGQAGLAVSYYARGVTAFPGLYVVGYPWLSNRGSGLLYGVTADAARVAQHIAMAALGHPVPAIPHPVPAIARRAS
jgi:hypothetical protein